MSAITVELQAVPALIASSIRSVLIARGYIICNASGPIDTAAYDAVFDELSRNAAQCLVGIDTNPENA